MPKSAPCGNSRAPRFRPRRRLGSAPIRIATPFVVLVLSIFPVLLTACFSPLSSHPTALDARDARRAAERWLAALEAGDSAVAHAGASCRAPGPAFRGATILRVDPPAWLSRRTLDSTATAVEEEARQAAADLRGAGEETADSLWLRSDAASRRAELCRNALRAAAMSGGGRDSTLRVCRIRVRIRWGGPLVGPEAVDREHVLRALAVPGGTWVVHSILPRDRDPASLPF